MVEFNLLALINIDYNKMEKNLVYPKMNSLKINDFLIG